MIHLLTQMLRMTPFDCAALVVLIILFLSNIIRGMTKSLDNKYYLALVAETIVCVFFDIASVLCLDMTENPLIPMIANTGYIFTHVLTSLLYLFYIFSITDTWHVIRRKKIHLVMLCLPMVATAGLLAYNFWSHKMFAYDGMVYQRGEWFLALYITPMFYLLFGAIYTLVFRKCLDAVQDIAVLSIIPFVLGAVAVQFYVPDLLLELFACSLSFLLLSVTTQRPEQMLDPITGCGSRSAYLKMISRNYATNRSFNIVMVDIHSIASLNATTNYDAQNKLQKSVADLIRKTQADQNINADIYQPEFNRFRLVLPTERMVYTTKLSESLQDSFRGLNFVYNICIVKAMMDFPDARSLISWEHNFNMYYTRMNEVQRVSDVSQKELNILMNTERIISNALEKNSIEMYYQPIYSVEKDAFVSAEALMRLTDEQYGPISPFLLISTAERNGMIHMLGNYTFREVCKFLNRPELEELGLEYVEFNLSVEQCMNVDLADDIIHILEDAELPPTKVNLEITESAASSSAERLMGNVSKLYNYGFTFSLDDYGTGYSNITGMLQYPLDIIKIDKSFVDNWGKDNVRAVIESTIAMFKKAGYKVLVEGIETKELADAFIALGVDYIQGYYYARPMNGDAFVEFLRKAV